MNKDIDHNRLKIQLLMLPDMIKTVFAGEVSVKKVPMWELFRKSDIYWGMLSEIDKVLKIYFIFLATSTTAER